MTKDKLLEAIDKRINELYKYRCILCDREYYLLERMTASELAGLQWVRDLIKEPPGAS